jgi:hypothetical protein
MLCACLSILLVPATSVAADAYYDGHLKYFYNYADFPGSSVFAGPANPYREHLGNLRLNLESRSDHWSTEVNYVMNALYNEGLSSCAIRGALITEGCSSLGSDAGQLFDMSTILSTSDDALLAQRIDRLWLAWSSSGQVARFGRQAISWGNGMVYNTLDLFNPFAPDAIDTDYKRGEDMFYLQNLFDDGSDLQMLAIPRRNTLNGELDSRVSAVAAKLHWLAGQHEADLLAAVNYGDTVLGAGFTTELDENVVNANLTVTDTDDDTVLSAVINYNFSSVVKEKNLTGFLEVYYNGFGLPGKRYSLDDVARAADLYSRLQRGELYTTGRYYLAGGVRAEITPLLQLNPTLFVNLGDGSGMLQFIVTYSLSQNLDLLGGINLPAGADGTEFGGLRAREEGERLLAPADQLFTRLAWYF